MLRVGRVRVGLLTGNDEMRTCGASNARHGFRRVASWRNPKDGASGPRHRRGAAVVVALVAAGVALGAPGIASADLVGVIPSPTSINFGSVVASQSASRTVTLTNTGLLAASLSVDSVPDYSADYSACASVPSGGNCTATITFTPSVVGSDNGSVGT